MTFTTRAEAKRDAEKLARALNRKYGTGAFKPRFHENLGWHSGANSTNLHVWESRPGYFCCLLGEDGGGCGIWRSGDGNNPFTAIRRALENARESVHRYLNIVCGAAEQTGQSKIVHKI